MSDAELKLLRAFPNSFINYNGEFIAHKKSNAYFILHNCRSDMDIKCKVLEWLSRAAFKTCPYSSDKSNNQFHNFMLEGINNFLETNFDEDDIEVIYTYLGNAIRHDLTVKFIKRDYDMSIFDNLELLEEA